MAKDEAKYFCKVYFKSEREWMDIKARSAMQGKKISTYIRDLVMIDLHMANLKSYADTSENAAAWRKAVKAGAEDPTGLVYGEKDKPLHGQITLKQAEEMATVAEQLIDAEEAEKQRMWEELKRNL